MAHGLETMRRLNYEADQKADRKRWDEHRAAWCPQECPITGAPFFCWMEHPIDGWVPTYGGPFDSYTIPTRQVPKGCDNVSNVEFSRTRYDHDWGGWSDDETLSLRLIEEEDIPFDEETGNFATGR